MRPHSIAPLSSMRRVKKACISSSAIPSRWSTQPSNVTLMLKVRSPMEHSPLRASPIRFEAEGFELVRKLAVEGRDGVVSVRRRECDDRGISEAAERMGPELQHAAPWTVIDDLHARESGHGVDDSRGLGAGRGGLGLSPR